MINVVCSLIRFSVCYGSIAGSAEQTALAVCSLVGASSQCAQIVIIIESAEQTALAVCSLVRVSLPEAQVVVLVEIRTVQNQFAELNIDMAVP